MHTFFYDYELAKNFWDCDNPHPNFLAVWKF